MAAWLSVILLGSVSATAGTAAGWAVARWLSARAAVGLGLAILGGLVGLVWATSHSPEHDGLAWATLGSVMLVPAAVGCAAMGMAKLRRRRKRRGRA